MSDFLKALSAITTSLQQGAPHLRAFEALANDAAEVVASVVPGGAPIATAVSEVTGAVDAVVDSAQQTLTGSVVAPPVPASLAMAVEVGNTLNASLGVPIAAPVSVSMTASGPVAVTAPAPVPGAIVSLPDNSAPVAGQVDAASLAAAGAASQAATPDQVIARLMVVESALTAILPLIADYAKQRGM